MRYYYASSASLGSLVARTCDEIARSACGGHNSYFEMRIVGILSTRAKSTFMRLVHPYILLCVVTAVYLLFLILYTLVISIFD